MQAAGGRAWAEGPGMLHAAFCWLHMAVVVAPCMYECLRCPEAIMRHACMHASHPLHGNGGRVDVDARQVCGRDAVLAQALLQRRHLCPAQSATQADRRMQAHHGAHLGAHTHAHTQTKDGPYSPAAAFAEVWVEARPPPGLGWAGI